jgi:DNA-binding LacI/PurR family transcriptional regulator
MDDPEHLWVDVDGRFGVHAATTHLIDAGLRKIAYLGWPVGSGTGDERRGGWEDAMAEAGILPDHPDLLTAEAEEGVGYGREATHRMIGRAGEVDAVVAASDGLALGAMLATAGRIPVVGFDNTPVAAAIGFSSVEQPLADVATGVLDLLTGAHGGRISHGDTTITDPRHRLVRPRLVVREQSAALRVAD